MAGSTLTRTSSTSKYGPLFYWGPPVAYALLLFFLSSQSRFTMMKKPVIIWDKMVHLFEYAILALLMFRAWLGSSRWSSDKVGKSVLVIIMLTSLYGASDELHQRFVPGRSAEFNDWLMDTLGAILFLTPFLLPSIKNSIIVHKKNSPNKYREK